MIMLNFLNFFKGCVLIKVDGFFTERFINLCINDGILLWDIKRAGEERLYAKISPSDYKRIRKAALKTKSRVSIIKKSGLPFLLFRYRKRKFAFFGVVIFCLMLLFYNSHIMGISIEGNERLETEKVAESLKDYGIYRLAPIKDVNNKLVQNKMMTKHAEIAWIGINIRGSRVYIEIKERLDTKMDESGDIPCDIVAKKSGIIDELDIREGQNMVKPKEFVQKGDLLVSGAIDSNVQGIRYVRSYGEVYAFTEEEKSAEYKMERIEKTATGKTKKKLSLINGEKEIKLYIREEPGYKNYEKKETKKNLFFGMVLKTDIYSEQEVKKVKRSEKETFEFGKGELVEELKKELSASAEIKNISAKYEKKDDETLIVDVKFELRENIAEQRPIDKIENLNYDIQSIDNNEGI